MTKIKHTLKFDNLLSIFKKNKLALRNEYNPIVFGIRLESFKKDCRFKYYG